MADSKLTALTATTTPALTDIFYIVVDPGGTPLSRKVTRGDALGADLTDLITQWTPASSSGPASLIFLEDTDNGTNKATVSAPSSLASDATVTLPDTTGTVAVRAAGARVDTNESTSSTSYTDLTTTGPTVSNFAVPASGQVIVTLTASMDQNQATGFALMSVALSGANTVAAADSISVAKQGTNFETGSGRYLLTGLTPGATTFTAKYRADTAGTAEFQRRNLIVEGA